MKYYFNDWTTPRGNCFEFTINKKVISFHFLFHIQNSFWKILFTPQKNLFSKKTFLENKKHFIQNIFLFIQSKINNHSFDFIVQSKRPFANHSATIISISIIQLRPRRLTARYSPTMKYYFHDWTTPRGNCFEFLINNKSNSISLFISKKIIIYYLFKYYNYFPLFNITFNK